MYTNLIRDAYGSPIPQTFNRETGYYEPISRGNATLTNFGTKVLLRDAYGSVIPEQYFDAELGEFVQGTLNPGGGGGGGDLNFEDLKVRVFKEEMVVAGPQQNDFDIPFAQYEVGLPTTIFRNGIKVRDELYEIFQRENDPDVHFVRFTMDITIGTTLSIEIVYLVDMREGTR